MLEFIVLGRIPGSHVQITITWLWDMLLFGLAVYLLYIDYKLIHSHTAESKSASKAQPGQLIRHIGAILRVYIVRLKTSWIHLLIGPNAH